ncbi:hypothetical protein B1207_15670 [Legionella quinlivanii]|uniref:Transmembrane protein n=1 Tax=Legionella quinlivanii TaxID=45073 RepID=A0A364LFA9_9GAMM|nr:hypothetical protein B1207_15670 [Legionella quinlivanii]
MNFDISKIIQIIKNNALGLWYSSLLLSLLIFSIYFLEIKYFPIRSYDSLIALSLFVSFVLVIIIFLLTLPPSISSNLQKRLINNEHTCSFLFGNKFRLLFDKLVIKKKKRRAEIKLIGKLIKTFLFLHIINATLLSIIFYFMPITAMLITMIIPLISIFVLLTNSKTTSSPSPSKIILIFYTTIVITTSNLFLLIATGLINHLEEITPESGINYIISTFSTYFCLLAYSIFVLIPLPDIKSKLQKPLILTVVIVTILSINGSIIRLPKLIIETFRIGNPKIASY